MALTPFELSAPALAAAWILVQLAAADRDAANRWPTYQHTSHRRNRQRK